MISSVLNDPVKSGENITALDADKVIASANSSVPYLNGLRVNPIRR